MAGATCLARRGGLREGAAAAAAPGWVTAAAAGGACLYPAYRTQIKPALFATAPAVGFAFERKEHLAIAALILSWAGLCLHWFNGRADPGEIHLGRAAFLAFAWAAGLAPTAAGLGTIVAITRTF